MGLITKIAKVKWSSSNKKHYESLGYIYTKMGDELEVQIKDVLKNSHIKIICICDNCGKDLSWTYQEYNKCVKEDGKTYCKKCANNLYGNENYKKTRLKNSKSFYDWCIENNRQDVLDRWDYKLNDCSPKEVSYGTNKKYWFKCGRYKKHGSELKNIKTFTSGQSYINCKQCNSIAHYILDNFPNKKLEEVWDYDKNGDLDPWSISKNSGKKYWFICQEKDYHGSYKIRCANFSLGQRCPYCCCFHGKVHPLDSLGQYITDNYGEDFLWKIWNDKNKISPFKVTVHGRKKYWWNCSNGEHKPFKRSCDSSVRYDFRCPKCVEEREESMIEEKTRTYLKELGYEVKTEYNCSIKPINPKTKQPLPFDNEIILENEKHLIIEVHGIQHYTIDRLYNKTQEDLEYQQYKDKYKKEQCVQMGYEYLELSYIGFDKEETYKKLINNKIKEILEK